MPIRDPNRNPDPLKTPEEKMATFHTALRGVLSVHKDDLDNMVKRDRESKPKTGKRGRPPKTSASAHASHGND
jgi:hypothetical protein